MSMKSGDEKSDVDEGEQHGGIGPAPDIESR
jgi:hypothetical protein